MTKRKTSHEEQVANFKKAAEEAECDIHSTDFDDAVKLIATGEEDEPRPSLKDLLNPETKKKR